MRATKVKMTKALLLRRKAQWRIANQFDFEEARRKTMEEKIRDVSSLLAFARSTPVHELTEREALLVRNRWISLKKAYRGRTLAT